LTVIAPVTSIVSQNWTTMSGLQAPLPSPVEPPSVAAACCVVLPGGGGGVDCLPPPSDLLLELRGQNGHQCQTADRAGQVRKSHVPDRIDHGGPANPGDYLDWPQEVDVYSG